MKDQKKGKSKKDCEILDNNDKDCLACGTYNISLCDTKSELFASLKEANVVTRKLTVELRQTIIMHRKNGKLLRDLHDEINGKERAVAP